LGVDFELIEAIVQPSEHWFRLHPGPGPVDVPLLVAESALHNNLIEQFTMTLQVVK
jgi:hypothetical protein